MRWMAYFILAYLALGFQIGLGGFIHVWNAAPNLVLLAAIFIAINAPQEAALLGCFCMGLMQDLVTQSPLGVYAMAYGLVAMFVVSTQQLVYHEHPLTHVSLALVGGAVTSTVLWVQGWVHPPGPAMTLPDGTLVAAVRLAPLVLFKSVLYTAVVAPLLLGGLQRIRRVFAFDPPRRRIRPYV